MGGWAIACGNGSGDTRAHPTAGWASIARRSSPNRVESFIVKLRGM